MKKKLTVNTLALGNLKHRKKQYTIMIIGIILAMVFSSSVIFFMFSANETYNENQLKAKGRQNSIVYSSVFNEDAYSQAVNDNILTDYGFEHIIGYAYTNSDSKRLGSSVAWLDDKAKDISYQIILEGKYPTADNEIAIEKTILSRLGYKDAQIGDTISLNFDIQNDDEYLKTVEKEYTLVGIMSDKKVNIENNYIDDEYDTLVPAIFVAQNTNVDLGGKEKLGAYVYTNKNSSYTSYVGEDGITYYCDSTEFLERYIAEKSGDSPFEMNTVDASENSVHYTNFESLFDGGDYFVIIIFVLIFASCVAIVNSFNSNLKERKKQIGMLRAVGATKRQIFNIFGREAFLISLITTPISIGISYAIVKILLSIISEDAIMSKSIVALPISAVFDIIIVMMASLVPLAIASRISPMQAIRNINNTRKVKTKKIKSQKEFSVPNHLAKRNLQFYKGSRIAISVILVVTIVFSAFMFSYLSYAKNDIRSIPADYILESLSDTGGTYYNEASKGLTESERQDINDLPYVASTTGEKKASAMIEVDEINDFVRVINSERYEYSGDHAPTSVDEFASNVRYGDAEENYYNNLEFLNINSEVITTKIYGYDDEQLADLENASIDGKIDFDKLNSGEEVILVAPKKAELSANFGNSCWGYRVTYDENVGKYDAGYKSVLVADCPYKVGDEITIDVATVTYDENTDEINSTNVTQKTVKVGAIVSINDVDDNDEFYLTDFCVLTNLQGINNFISNLDYITLNVTTNCDLDDEMDESITEDLKVYTNKYQGLLDSNYSYNTWQINNYRSFLITMISIIVICFAICISIVNNTISARIRENKKVIGTLRAVGASESDLVKSYIRQMLSMFSLGIVVGYGIFVVMYFAVWYIIKYHLLLTFVFVFNPWITIAMTGLMFVICSLNLWAKVRKEMKNSIVENIQEL